MIFLRMLVCFDTKWACSFFKEITKWVGKFRFIWNYFHFFCQGYFRKSCNFMIQKLFNSFSELLINSHILFNQAFHNIFFSHFYIIYGRNSSIFFLRFKIFICIIFYIFVFKLWPFHNYFSKRLCHIGNMVSPKQFPFYWCMCIQYF